MEKQILKAVEEAYRKGLKDAKGLNDISPFLLTSQIVAHEVANKFCQPLVSGQLEALRKDFCLWYYAQSQPLDAHKVVDWFDSNFR